MTYDIPRVPAQYAPGDGCEVALDLRVAVCPGLTVSVAARLRYLTADPYAVFLDNHTDLATPITWVFARDLLATGVHGWSGIGSVSVHPGVDERSDSVFITLTGEGSSVVLRAPAEPVRAFLARTESLVPIGQERTHLDLDGLLRRLSEGGAASPGP